MGGYHGNFQKQSDRINSLGVPYDYNSVMHYRDTSFSSNGKKTIIPLQSEQSIGQRNGISKGDRLQLRLMYQCKSGPRNYSQFRKNKCDTSDCKCGKNWKGCGTDNLKCKGSLVCVKNRCKKMKS